MRASFIGNEEVVKVLIKGRAIVDVQNKVLLDWTFISYYFFLRVVLSSEMHPVYVEYIMY